MEQCPVDVALDEIPLLFERADAGDPQDRLVQPLVDRALRPARQALQLPRRAPESQLQPLVHEHQRQHEGEEQGDVECDDAGAHGKQHELIHEVRRRPLRVHVELLHVLRKSIDHPARRCSVQPRHRGPEHLPQRVHVHRARDLQRGVTEQSGSHDDRSKGAEHHQRVDPQGAQGRGFLVGRHDGPLLRQRRRPLRQERRGNDLQSLVGNEATQKRGGDARAHGPHVSRPHLDVQRTDHALLRLLHAFHRRWRRRPRRRRRRPNPRTPGRWRWSRGRGGASPCA
mmetsp:Transcript_87634/g.268150  ORF Transcript_87634/g.268150 Transcript_87634/m.268150 type:complete len:284 (+) Transcript_87634:1097-1948(+)